MRTRTIIAALLGFAQPMFAIDPSEPAIDQALAPAATDAAAAPASDAGESNGGAPVAAGAPESDTSSSVVPASLSSDTAAADGLQDDTPAVLTAPAMTADQIEAAKAVIAAAPMGPVAILEADPTPTVSIDVEDHAEARERFAGLLARLHNAEEDFAHALRNELNAIGTLLHLHSVASGKADSTGDYSSSDLS
ncbi:hypothetical protein [Burkholderia ambifaria]|jgi:hypothetical protein|uniref:hypothetical protein n=1 Tax=Burkholderia ambifaria TaxID=152480 RepID=UPI00158E7E71|nr:hypothetical protein [Burkholderia ambifaria]